MEEAQKLQFSSILGLMYHWKTKDTAKKPKFLQNLHPKEYQVT